MMFLLLLFLAQTAAAAAAAAEIRVLLLHDGGPAPAESSFCANLAPFGNVSCVLQNLDTDPNPNFLAHDVAVFSPSANNFGAIPSVGAVYLGDNGMAEEGYGLQGRWLFSGSGGGDMKGGEAALATDLNSDEPDPFACDTPRNTVLSQGTTLPRYSDACSNCFTGVISDSGVGEIHAIGLEKGSQDGAKIVASTRMAVGFGGYGSGDTLDDFTSTGFKILFQMIAWTADTNDRPALTGPGSWAYDDVTYANDTASEAVSCATLLARAGYEDSDATAGYCAPKGLIVIGQTPGPVGAKWQYRLNSQAPWVDLPEDVLLGAAVPLDEGSDVRLTLSGAQNASAGDATLVIMGWDQTVVGLSGSRFVWGTQRDATGFGGPEGCVSLEQFTFTLPVTEYPATTGATTGAGSGGSTPTTTTTTFGPALLSANAVRIQVTQDVAFSTYDWTSKWRPSVLPVAFPTTVGVTGLLTEVAAVAGSTIVTADLEATGAPTNSTRPLACLSLDAANRVVSAGAIAGLPNITNAAVVAQGSAVSGASCGGVSSTSGPGTETAPAEEAGSEADAFPWWIVLAAIGACCCVLLLFAAVLVIRRRQQLHESQSEGSELELAGDDDEDEEEIIYDSITKALQASIPAQLQAADAYAEANDNYARIPDMETVAGNYAKIPSHAEQAAGVAMVSPVAVMLDTSAPIGHGEFGDVFKGEFDGMTVAVKMVRANLGEEGLVDFYKEAQIIAGIPPHEFVVSFVGCTPDPLMIVTEFCSRGSLRRFLRRSTEAAELTVEQELKIVRDVAEGMAHLAECGIVHRDLAARNILLTGDMTPRISDFGLSRTLEERALEGRSNTAMGPARWWAVESIKKGVYSEKSDVWSWSVLAWEVHSRGDVPYGRKTPSVEAARGVLSGKRLAYDTDRLPQAVVKLYARCTLAEPKKRPNFEECVTVLDDTTEEQDLIYASLADFKDNMP